MTIVRKGSVIGAAIGIMFFGLFSILAQGQAPKEPSKLPEASAVISTITLGGFQRLFRLWGLRLQTTKTGQ